MRSNKFLISIFVLVAIITIPTALIISGQRTAYQQSAAKKENALATLEQALSQRTDPEGRGAYERLKVCEQNNTPQKCLQDYLTGVPAKMPPVHPTDTHMPKNSQSPSIGPGAAAGRNSTVLTISVCPHGIGDCGDSVVSPGIGNPHPQHPVRTITISLLTNNKVVAVQQGSVSYDPAAQHFSGTVDMGTVPTGLYSVKYQMTGYLSAMTTQAQSIKARQLNILPLIYLIAGDINHDNIVGMADYNLLMLCYSDLQQSTTCTSGQQQAADINDDGAVNSIDYNLFTREMSLQRGM